MNDQDFQQRLGELMNQIQELPEAERGDVARLAEETRDRHDRMRKTIGELQDSLDYLRLSVKYLVFDLEATRRENQYLRRLLERQHRPEADHDGDE
jgi:chromosome segregation ATPase